jgi:hypothetical protein
MVYCADGGPARPAEVADTANCIAGSSCIISHSVEYLSITLDPSNPSCLCTFRWLVLVDSFQSLQFDCCFACFGQYLFPLLFGNRRVNVE